MTYSTVSEERESSGSMWAWFHTINVTSLDGAGAESYDPGSRFNAEVLGVDVIGQEDESLDIVWDHLDGELKVAEISDTGDGTGGRVDVAQGTDIGEVQLRIDGK